MALAAAYHPRFSSCLYVCHLDQLMARACVLAWETWRIGVLDTFFSTTLSFLSWLTAGESDLFVKRLTRYLRADLGGTGLGCGWRERT